MLFAVNAAAETKNGTIPGTNIDWTYDTGTYTLKLSGSGALPDYNDYTFNNRYFKAHEDAVIATYNIPEIGELKYYIIDYVKHIEIGSGINTIGMYYFYGASKLETLTLNESVTAIKDYAFWTCTSLSKIEGSINNNIEVASSAFKGCNFVKNNNGILVMGNTLVAADSIFIVEKNVEEITIPSDVTKIKSEAFKNCKSLQTITIKGNLTSIGDRVFENCSSLNNINIPSSVTTWGQDIFRNCTSLPNDGTYQKAGDHVIVKVVATEKSDYTIPGNIIYIAEDAFIGCTKAQNIFSEHSYGKMPKAASTAFDFDGFEPNYYVADGNEEACQTNWKATEPKINHTQITVGKTGYATVTILHHSAKVPKGIEAYTAKVEGDQVKLSKVLELAKGEGYILIGDTKTHDFGPAKYNVSKPKNNSMVGVTTDTEVSGDDCYVLCPADDGGVEFLCVGSETARITAGKSYLYVPNSPARLSIYNDNNETGIEETSEYHDTQNNNSIYNLAGQKLTQPKKGLNVINGKLVLM